MTTERDPLRYAAIAAPQRAATEAGREAFERGGNAFDAILAAALSLTVVYPHNCALGGDLFALVCCADGTREVINASGPAAAAVDAEALRATAPRMPLTGPAPVTVPGLLAGLEGLWAGGARLGWEEAFGTAIRQAREGFPVAGTLAGAIAAAADSLSRDPGCRGVFLDGDAPLGEGDTLRQPALATTLEQLAADGPKAFYGGPLGRSLVDTLRSHGSPLDLDDLARFVPERVPAHVRTIGGVEVATAPPNSQGFLLPLILGAALGLDPDCDPLGPGAGGLARIFRASLVARERFLADPAHAPDAFDGIDDLDLRAAGEGLGPIPPATGDTVAIVAADEEGNSISLLQSLFHSFGAQILDPATGILVHNRGSFFSLDPESPNVIAPGKRPAHTLTPCTVLRDGRPETVIATMGGSSQPQILAEVLLALRRGAAPDAVLRAPRWIVPGPFAPGAPEEILVEDGVPEAARRSLAELGLPLRSLPDLDGSVGHTQLIVRRPDGHLTAASDPRSEGAAAVVERRGPA